MFLTKILQLTEVSEDDWHLLASKYFLIKACMFSLDYAMAHTHYSEV